MASFILLLGVVFIYGKQFLSPLISEGFLSSGEQVSQAEVKNVQQDILPTLGRRKLSGDEYTGHREAIRKLVEEQDPRAALDYIKKMKSEGKVEYECHELTHEVGNLAYEKYRDPIVALTYKIRVCGYGYIHGVIEEYINDTPDAMEILQGLCQKYPNERDEFECYHGVGHGLMIYSSNDVPAALAVCDQYQEDKAKSLCGVGVFMENFMADKAHQSRYVKPDDPLYPCSEQKDIYKQRCYEMAPMHYLAVKRGDFSSMLAWCDTVEGRFKSSCARGTIFSIVHYTEDSKIIEQFCQSSTEELRDPCIRGFVRYRLDALPMLADEAARDKVRESCQEFASSVTQAICRDAAETEEKL